MSQHAPPGWKLTVREQTIYEAGYYRGAMDATVSFKPFDPMHGGTRMLDCQTCDGYVIDQAEAPYCPTCARERRTAAGPAK